MNYIVSILYVTVFCRARVVSRVGTARELVAGSLDQVRAGEHALVALAAHTAHTR